MAMNGSGNGTGSPLPEDRLQKVGRALGAVSAISEAYAERIGGAATPEDKQVLLEEAQRAASVAVGEQGLSVEEYNKTITDAEDNPDLQHQLVEAARAA